MPVPDAERFIREFVERQPGVQRTLENMPSNANAERAHVAPLSGAPCWHEVRKLLLEEGTISALEADEAMDNFDLALWRLRHDEWGETHLEQPRQLKKEAVL